MGLFWKGKSHFKAEFHKIDLYVGSLLGGEYPFYNRITELVCDVISYLIYCLTTGSLADDCVEITECSNVDCGDHGNCMSYDNGYNYKCKCDIGYAGQECLSNVDDCAARPCQNGASCSDGINDYSCSCTLDGTGGKFG